MTFLSQKGDVHSWLDSVGAKFKLKNQTLDWFKGYFELINTKQYDKLTEYCQSSTTPYLFQSVEPINEVIVRLLRIESLPIKHTAVISTMSSGKSTFINALLGDEIFPESQAACTAKITSIYDNDDFENLSGIAFANNQIKHLEISIDQEKAREWNSSDEIDRVMYEGDLKNIFNHERIVAIHDTPGTNFSSDETHKKITIDFLENTPLDTIIFLLNAMYMNTNDSAAILKQVKKIAADTQAKVLFVLNKIDALDTEKESVEEAMEATRAFIENHGFENPTLISTSAKAIRLFKMILHGNSDKFSEDEVDDLNRLLRKFLKQRRGAPSESRDSVTIEGTSYLLHDIHSALECTNYFKLIEEITN